jgi:cytochrome c peroxidase
MRKRLVPLIRRLRSAGLAFSSDAQAPGDSVTVGFPEEGRYEAICGIHPQMRLTSA